MLNSPDDVKLELTIGPTVVLRIINRSTLLKYYFKKYKNTSTIAPDSVIYAIKNRVMEDDKLPDGANLILTTEYRSDTKAHTTADDIHGPEINSANTWQARLVLYKKKLVVLISPDAGLYRFKPVCVTSQLLNKNKAPEWNFVTILDEIIVPFELMPLYYDPRPYFKVALTDATYQLSSYLITNVIWPSLVPSRQVLAIAHLQPDRLTALVNSNSGIVTSAERLIVSKNKNSNKLVVSKLEPRVSCKLSGWLLGNASYNTVDKVFMDSSTKKVIWLKEGVKYEELLNDIKLSYTLDAL
jgi:hypothetical protein